MSTPVGYIPNERIVDRAVALWLTMLERPKYDNLGSNSPEPEESIRVNKLAAILTSGAAKNNTPAVLQRFGVALREILLNGHKYKSRYEGDKIETLPTLLSVDYQPNVHLAAAAERAELKMEFPWKTSMHLAADHLSLSYGYGSPYVYHYPLTKDRWLVTTLHGTHIAKIISLVEAGVLTPELEAAIK